MSRWTSCEQERLDRMVIFLTLKASYLKVVDRSPDSLRRKLGLIKGLRSEDPETSTGLLYQDGNRDGCFYIGKVVPTATYNTVQFLYIAVVSRQRP